MGEGAEFLREIMHSPVKLLLFDYKLIGTTMGTHTSVQINEHEYWFSITGLKKRNRLTGTIFQFNESRRKWEQRVDSASSTSMLSFDYLNHLTSSVRNLGSISSHTSTPREVIECGETQMSEGGLEANIKQFIYYEFLSVNYNLEAMNCNTFSRFLVQYLNPSNKDAGLERLSQVILETAETVIRVEKKHQRRKGPSSRLRRQQWTPSCHGRRGGYKFCLA